MEEQPYLADGIEYIVIETDEENPVTVAVIDKTVTPRAGYRIRVKFGR